MYDNNLKTLLFAILIVVLVILFCNCGNDKQLYEGKGKGKGKEKGKGKGKGKEIIGIMEVKVIHIDVDHLFILGVTGRKDGGGLTLIRLLLFIKKKIEMIAQLLLVHLMG